MKLKPTVLIAIFWISYAFVFSSCKDRSDSSKVSSKQIPDVGISAGDTIVFPAYFPTMVSIQDSTFSWSNLLSTTDGFILSYVASDCSECAKSMDGWRKILRDGYIGLPVVFVAYGSSRASTAWIVNDVLNLKEPVFFDEWNGFAEANKLEGFTKHWTFLIDSQGIVRTVGNPVFDSPLLKRYSAQAKKLQTQ